MTSAQITYPITVYYDHSCVLCRSEILHIKARDELGSIVLIDCSASDFDDSQLPHTKAELLACIRAQDDRGNWLVASDVFVALYSTVGLHGIASAWQIGKPIAEKMYPWIARNRHVISKLGVHKLFNFMTERHLKQKAQVAMQQSQACKDDACKVDSEIRQNKL